MAQQPERVARLTDRREADSVKIARLETTVGGMAEDVSEIKADLRTFKEQFEHRLSYVEDVRLRGIEEREIRRNAIADERARAADAAQAAAEDAAAHAAAQKKQHISGRQFVIGTALIVAATVSAQPIGHLIGQLF